MGKLGDSTTRLVFPVDANLGPMVVASTRTFLRLYHPSSAASGFVTRRLHGVIQRLARRKSSPPFRATLTLQRRAGRIQVAFRIARAGTDDLRLSPLAKGAPSAVRAEYRPGRGGGTLAFTLIPKDSD